MARSSDPNSASSQFFVCLADAPFLDRQYTVFAKVHRGMDVVDAIANAPTGLRDHPKVLVRITKVILSEP
jgi:cyclophilin family peptidyl-prolyl cis-trans isomerase